MAEDLTEIPESVIPESVGVDIYDQVYQLRGTDPAYIQRLATRV